VTPLASGLILAGPRGVDLLTARRVHADACDRMSSRRKPDGPPDLGRLLALAGMSAFAVAWALIFLAPQGSATALGTRSAHVNSEGLLPLAELNVLGLVLFYALPGGPEIVRRKLPFEHASEQASRLVPAGLATAAAVVTGSYMLALHFFGQPR
jgi:hypothetical protein